MRTRLFDARRASSGGRVVDRLESSTPKEAIVAFRGPKVHGYSGPQTTKRRPHLPHEYDKEMTEESQSPTAASRTPLSEDTHENQLLPVQPQDEGRSSPLADYTEKERSLSTKAQDLTSFLLDWLSNASNESLGACLVGLGASTYFVLGRLGLVLIGIAGGIVLHATWEYNGRSHEGDDAKALELKRRREVGLDVVKRVVDWRERPLDDQEGHQNGSSAPLTAIAKYSEVNFSSFKPATGAALESLTDAVIKDYVKWWYSPLLPYDVSFPSSCRQTLVGFFLTFSSHLSRKRPADTFIDFLTNSASIIVVFMNELSSALMLPGANNAECTDALHRYLENSPDSHLANVMDVEQQQRKLKAIAEDILHSFLDSSAYKCEPIKAFLREVLAGLILEMTVQSCSKPEFINGWIIYLLEEGDTELIDAIDAGVSSATGKSSVKDPAPSMVATDVVESDQGHSPVKGQSNPTVEHRRTVSRAEDAMEQAMQEAKRLTELIAAEEAKSTREDTAKEVSKSRELLEVESSGATTPNGPTPSSSASDVAASRQSFEGHGANYPTQPAETPVSASFTSFDQILPPKQTTALQETAVNHAPAVPPLTLYNATVSIFDDAQPGEKSTIRSKPQADYLIQIEPATPQHPGWMIARKYPDFETLHEVLRRISVVSGVPAFAQKHSVLPAWKNRTKAELRSALEHYLRDALSFSRLAESEGMKRFLERDQGSNGNATGASKSGFGFPSPAAFENMGKGMLDVLASAPKGAAGGGKAILGGFTGVVGGLGSIGQKKQASVSPNRPSTSSVPRPSSTLSMTESHDSSDIGAARKSQDSVLDTITTRQDPEKGPPLPSRASNPSSQKIRELAASPNHNDTLAQTPANGLLNDPFVESSQPDEDGQTELHLPPPPSEIPDDYNTSGGPERSPDSGNVFHRANSALAAPPSELLPPSPAVVVTPKTQSHHADVQPLTEPETRVAVELFFALINELYTLSSAWNIRRTLLNAAKSYLLRPGNPSLTSIQQLLQTSLDANTSDEGIAAHLTKLRENSLPTEEESKKWPAPPNEEEKEKLRRKARKLLVGKGMPAALTSVMGAAASGEALGRVFDSLQVESVARGFMFAIILQAIKAIAQ